MNKKTKTLILLVGMTLGALWGAISLFSASTCFLHWNYPHTGGLCKLIYDNMVVRLFFGIPLLYFIKDGVMISFLVFPPILIGGLIGSCIAVITAKLLSKI